MSESSSWHERILAKFEEEGGNGAGRVVAAVACELLGKDPEAYRAYIRERALAEAAGYFGFRTGSDREGALRQATRFVVNTQLRALDRLVNDRVLNEDSDRRRIAYEAMNVWLDVGRAIQEELGR